MQGDSSNDDTFGNPFTTDDDSETSKESGFGGSPFGSAPTPSSLGTPFGAAPSAAGGVVGGEMGADDDVTASQVDTQSATDGSSGVSAEISGTTDDATTSSSGSSAVITISNPVDDDAAAASGETESARGPSCTTVTLPNGRDTTESLLPNG